MSRASSRAKIHFSFSCDVLEYYEFLDYAKGCLKALKARSRFDCRIKSLYFFLLSFCE